MWVQLLEPVTGLFFPSKTLVAGERFSIGDPRGRKLISEGKAVQIAFPGGGDADQDNVEGLRKKYKQANPDHSLWDERVGARYPTPPWPEASDDTRQPKRSRSTPHPQD